jgi:hypothetical protein
VDSGSVAEGMLRRPPHLLPDGLKWQMRPAEWGSPEKSRAATRPGYLGHGERRASPSSVSQRASKRSLARVHAPARTALRCPSLREAAAEIRKPRVKDFRRTPSRPSLRTLRATRICSFRSRHSSRPSTGSDVSTTRSMLSASASRRTQFLNPHGLARTRRHEVTARLTFRAR